jgi:hypothetical protein
MLKGRSATTNDQQTDRKNGYSQNYPKVRMSSNTYNDITELHPFYAPDSSTSGIDYTFDIDTMKYDVKHPTTTPIPFAAESKSAPVRRTVSNANIADYRRNMMKSSFTTNKAFGYSYRYVQCHYYIKQGLLI